MGRAAILTGELRLKTVLIVRRMFVFICLMKSSEALRDSPLAVGWIAECCLVLPFSSSA